MSKLIIKLIKFYQNKISKNTSPRCKYTPTCSQYSLECFQKFTFFVALGLTIFRVLRCNPFSHGGYDPVPKTKEEKLFESLSDLGNRPL